MGVPPWGLWTAIKHYIGPASQITALLFFFLQSIAVNIKDPKGTEIVRKVLESQLVSIPSLRQWTSLFIYDFNQIDSSSIKYLVQLHRSRVPSNLGVVVIPVTMY